MANLSIAEKAAANGATFITHLFNAMLPVSEELKINQYYTYILLFKYNKKQRCDHRKMTRD